MPEPNLKATRTYIWIVSCILFICITVAGGCLLVYISTPESQSSNLLPALGYTLICIPWIFWIVTVVYRITSRAFGFWMVIGRLYVNGGVSAKGASEGGNAAAVVNGAQILHVNTKSAPSSLKSYGKFEAKNSDIGPERNIKRASSSSSNISNESEMALVSSIKS